MANYICTTCGVQFTPTPAPPDHCPICEDERQYVNWHGQTGTTLGDLRAEHHNVIKQAEPGLIGIGTQPSFAIGQRALLVQAPSGNILWDCTSLIDEATIEAVQALGGLSAVAMSHPHFYASMVEWSHAFGGVPIYVHAADRAWVMRPDPAITFWEGDTHTLGEGIRLLHCGGHFDGATILHWAAGADGHGVLLTSDIIHVVGDRRYVSFMYSFPNLIPLAAADVHRIVQTLEPLTYERIYGAWFEQVVHTDARAAVIRSTTRYLSAIAGNDCSRQPLATVR